MKRISRPPVRKRMKTEELISDSTLLRHLTMHNKPANGKHLLLCHPNFVAKSKDPSFEPPPLACEASALTTELTAPNRSYLAPSEFYLVQAQVSMRFVASLTVTM